MDFKLKNFGKIADADIKLDGITVICGDNNTGKSTVGKALFCFYNSLYNFFMKKYEISDKVNYYIPESTDKGVIMKSCGNDSVELKKSPYDRFCHIV